MPNNISTDQLAQLAGIDTPTISNAIEGFAVRNPTVGHMGADIRCLTPHFGPMVGYAVTVTLDNASPERDPGAAGIKALYTALAEAPKPAVVVFQDVSTDRLRSCHLGDGMSALFQRLGAVGALTNGNIRDLKGIKALGFRIFAAGEVASRGLLQVMRVNVPVELSGAQITPGDLIHADDNGAITVPLELVGKLAEAALAVRQKESVLHDYALSPDFTIEGLLERMK